MLEMKQNREAGEEDEASAQLALFSSAETLTPVVFFWFYMLAPSRLGLFRSRCGCCCLLACFTSTGQAGNSILFRNACRKDFRGQEIPGISQTWRVSRQQRVYLIRQQAWNNQWSNISTTTVVLTLPACCGVYF